MRYTNWDVLMFADAGETKIPLQEFRTICEVIQEPGTSHPLFSFTKQALTTTQEADAVPTPANGSSCGPLAPLSPIVSCFVPSLAIGCPFRISVHSWNPPTPSAGMKLGVQENRPFVIEAAVFIDGAQVTTAVFEPNESWPQIIDDAPHTMRFPKFHTELLQQQWADPSQDLGRIKITIAEGLRDHDTSAIEKRGNVVSFAFQHAPLAILEDTGVAWPSRAMWDQARARSDKLRPPQRSGTPFSQLDAPLPRRQSTPAWTPHVSSKPRAPLNSISPSENRKLANLGSILSLPNAPARPDPFTGSRKHLGRMTLPVPDSEQLFPQNGTKEQTMTSDSSTSAHMWCDPLLPGSTRSFSPAYILGNDAAGPTPQSPGKIDARRNDPQALRVFSDFSDHARTEADINPPNADVNVTTTNRQVPQRPAKATNGRYGILVSQDARNESQTGSPFGEGIAIDLPERLHRTGTPSPEEWNDRGMTRKDVPGASTSSNYGRLPNMDAMRAASLTTRDPYKAKIREDPTAKDPACESRPRGFDAEKPGNSKHVSAYRPTAVNMRVSSNVRGRKEGHPDFAGGDSRPADRDKANSTLAEDHSKENTRKADQLTPHNGIPKRRRVSKTREEGTSSRRDLVGSRENRSKESGSPVKLDGVVDLTADGVMGRSTLREISGNVL